MTPNHWIKLKELFQAAFELSPEDRAKFLDEACDGDRELRTQVEKLIASHEDAGEFLASSALIDAGVITEPGTEPSPDTERVGQHIGPYKILREIGRGGMGTVFLAARADDQYQKQVAVKVVNRGMDTDTILRRFVMERQILADLEHPNIARLLEGGTTTDGLPYFVMEYVDGEPIDEYCDSHRFSTTKRLELFREVCGALQYAHQNLVIHRDIKPGNILVTSDGVPKLLDFGIAKLLTPEWAGDATITMQRLMTPAYASPEQLRGVSITTSTDVYSLGVVLYELLCGHRPHSLPGRQPDEIAEIILSEEPLKPSVAATRPAETRSAPTTGSLATTPESIGRIREGTLDRLRRRLSGDLDNIVLKALRKEPERRYASVQEFSEDIRRHLVGLPVNASPDTFAYRAQKFTQRNRAAAIAASVVIVTLLGATVVTGWQARVARRERDRADQRFNQVRKLANSVLFDYHSGIQKLPGSTPVRERMVKDALEYLDNLSAESGNDPSLQREVATAYQKVGDVQGAPNRANLGNIKGALESYQRALAIRESLNTAKSNSELQLELAQSHGSVGEVLQLTGKIPEAIEHFNKAFPLLESMSPQTSETRHELALLHRRNARALAVTANLPKAIESHQKSIEIFNGEIAANPADKDLKRDLAFTHIFLGDALVEAGNLKEALAEEQTASRLLGPLIETNDAQSRRDANVANERIARVLGRMGDTKAVLEAEIKAAAIDEELAKADPSNALARRDVYIDYFKIAQTQAKLGDIKAALVNQQKFVDLCEAESARNPANLEIRGDLAAAHFFLGTWLESSGNMPAALQSYRKVLQVLEALSAADPSNARQRENLSEILTRVANMSMKFGSKAEVLDSLRRALAIREEMAQKNPDYVEGRAQLAIVYESLGQYFTTAGEDGKPKPDLAEARRRYQQSLDIWNELKNKGKLTEEYQGKPEELAKKVKATQ